MSAQEQESSGNRQMQTAQSREDDDEPMVHCVPADYASSAKKHLEELRSQGKEAILMSELPGQIPRRDNESGSDYAARYSESMNNLIRRGVHILNDQSTHNVAPDRFRIEGHDFDVGPDSGITKGAYRGFSQLTGRKGVTYADIPEEFLKFEVPPASTGTSQRR
ncbi:hypothetical protein K431DRAFT_302437 [Polychaeton citri CBS 116435]|uniref:Uncharacterized protein n=1 Tax=Polychaeton citri CBS 116435 TaxID=1314669 RepID=A0A9P4QAH0_9PEZI|nr:hypothetical protein K431DRAFT_302437 [Polychaeton citri CBS 116435]